MSQLYKLFKDESGESSSEYVLLMMFIAVVIIISVGLLGENVKKLYVDGVGAFPP